MANTYKTPGVYVEEISKFPPSVADVPTAIPAFIGYTAYAKETNVPIRISSLLEYELLFGGGAAISVESKPAKKEGDTTPPVITVKNGEFVLYDSIRLFYDNGGGICYIVSIGTYDSGAKSTDEFKKAITALEKTDEVTLILFPDAATCLKDAAALATVQQQALMHCLKMGDRFSILDVRHDAELQKDVQAFRNNIGVNGLYYGAAYYPYLETTYTKSIAFMDVYRYTSEFKDLTDTSLKSEIKKLADATKKDEEWQLKIDALIPTIPGYDKILKELNTKLNTIPPSGAIAGVISMVDSNKGIWHSPANVSISSISGVSTFITDDEQENLNVDSEAGKSINAIRSFSGKGILVWGARTLLGNDNEWRYISVRRLFNYIEESVKKSTAWAVFSPNDANTWIKIKSQIENFLNNLWRQGALAGSKAESAYYVAVGLNTTMTAQDILEGKLIIEIGLAAVRPAEFIILRFSHKLQE